MAGALVTLVLSVSTGKKHGITELHPDVVSYVSHATQQRLQNLVEKVSETAQQKNFSYKVPAVPGPLAVPQAPDCPLITPHCHLSGPLLFPQGPSLSPIPLSSGCLLRCLLVWAGYGPTEVCA